MSVPYFTQIRRNKIKNYDTDDICNVHLRKILRTQLNFDKDTLKALTDKEQLGETAGQDDLLNLL